jgi:hypothetical protein
MGARVGGFVSVATVGALMFIACEQPIRRPQTTPSSGVTFPAGGSEPSPTSTGSTSVSGSSSSASAGAGGAAPTAEVLRILTCADHETHVVDCESCRQTETQGTCTEEWQACLGDPYCGTSFFDCINACPVGSVTCENACFDKQPNSQNVIAGFVGCVCDQCVQFCG